MWQDALALFIVAIAVLMFLRPLFRIWGFHAADCQAPEGGLSEKASAVNGCGGCELGIACGKALSKSPGNGVAE